VQSFTARMPLLTATGAFGLGRRRWSSPQQCYLHCLCTLILNCIRLFLNAAKTLSQACYCYRLIISLIKLLCGGTKLPLATAIHLPGTSPNQSCPWVGLTHRLDRIGSRFFSFWWIVLGWVHYSTHTHTHTPV